MADQVRVFVSHHHSKDEDTFTARLVVDLEAAGADVWVDDQRITSDDFIKKINEGLAGRQWLVLVMTPDALRSTWVQAEVNAALNQVRKGRMLGVIPIVASPCDDNDIPPLLDALHRYDATRAYAPARDGLLRALGLPPLPPPAPQPQPRAATPPAAPAADPPQPQPRAATPPAPQPQPRVATPPAPSPSPSRPSYPLPEIPARLASLGYRGVNRAGTPTILAPLVSVAAGPFLMGSDKKRDKEADDRETPQHRVELAAYQIGKYPVTVAEYALAVGAGAVREPPTSGGVTWQSQLQHPDHPVVRVSWQDAQAYLVWLREATGQPDWRLPSEAQWEKAARWDAARGVSRIYPWGDSFDPKRCNTDASGIGTTTPIGSYPASDAQRSGASPCGAEDMTGNVWEWTSSVYKPYPYTPSDGREDANSTGNRTLRGGSWGNDARYSRAAFRYLNGWDYRNYGIGFRLALSSPAGS